MLRSRIFILLAVLVSLGVSASVAASGSTSPSEELRKREALRKKLGLPPAQDPPPKAEEPPPEPDQPEPQDEPDPDEDEPAAGAETSDPSDAPGGESSKPKTPRVTYKRVHRLLQSGCASCHKAGSSAGGTGLVLTGDADADYRSARKFTRRSSPKDSPLLTKGAGQSHGGGGPYPVGSSQYETILAWIESGTPRGGGSSKAVAVAPTPPATSPEPRPVSPPARSRSRSKPPGKPTPEAVATELAPAQPSEAHSAAPEEDPFVEVHGTLVSRCGGCHAPGKSAGSGRFVLRGTLEADRATVLALVDAQDPPASLLLTKGAGVQHGGGPSMPVDSEDYAQVLAWISAGARGPASAEEQAGSDGSTRPQVDAMTSASPPAPSRLGDGTALPEEQYGSNLPFSLPGNLRLNGRLDFSYERRDVKNHPFAEGGRNALATYHHFLFLSRSGAKDPFGFNVELLTRQFWEFNARWKPKRADVQLMWRAGKILVPFGDEPLFHVSYGGRTGFDQELLPVVWALPGAAFNIQGQAGPVSIGNDLYVVQGHGQRSPDAVLNLQSDISPLDDVNIAVGDRIGVSYTPFTAWYSFQFTPLGNGRLLFMQAIDAEFWRWRGVPVMENLVVGVGAMRADVSRGQAGGVGNDYYHFGSYGYARYSIIDELSVQYRAGLKTFDNRRGVFFDDTRIDERDRGSHNVAVTGRYRGCYAMMQFFWNLEKANEQDDDFLRLTVGYEF